MWDDWLIIVVGVSASVLAVRFVTPLLDNLYGSMSAPLGTVYRDVELPTDLTFYRGLWLLFACYFLTGFLFSLTAGTAGFFAATGANLAGPFKTLAGIKCGFLIGLLFAAFARIRGTVSSVLADQLAALATITLGIACFAILAIFAPIQSPARATIVAMLRYVQNNCFSAPIAAIIVTASSVLVVEGIIWAFDRIGDAPSRQLSRAELRRRIEQHDVVHQVFWHRRVQTKTDNIIGEVIRAEGVRSICWMTCTAPESHCKSIQEAAVAWAHAQPGVGTNANEVAATMIKANLRIIVPNLKIARQVREMLPSARRFRITRTPAFFRTRLLIINSKVAVVHLPIPFDPNAASQQSNFAAIINCFDGIQEVQSCFDDSWENLYIQERQRAFADMFVRGDSKECKILAIVSEYEHGITLENIREQFGSQYGQLDVVTLRSDLEKLIKDNFVCFDKRAKLYYPKRRHTVGHSLDSLTRLVRRDLVK